MNNEETNARQVNLPGLMIKPIDYFAITETEEQTVRIRWDIKYFNTILLNKQLINVESPEYVSGEGEDRLHWRLSFRLGCSSRIEPGNIMFDHYTLVLQLMNPSETPVRARIQVGLLIREVPFLTMYAEKDFTKSVDLWVGNKFLSIAVLIDRISAILEDDTLKIYGIISTPRNKGHNGKLLEGQSQTVEDVQGLASDFGTLFNTQAQMDCSVITKTKTFGAHRAFLVGRSPVFEAMFRNKMSEYDENIVEIPDFEEEVVGGMLQYMYSASICKKVLEKNSHELLKIANKYHIEGLRAKAENFIADALTVENAADSLILGDQHNAHKLKAKTVEFFNRNRKKIFDTTDGFQKLLNYSPPIFAELYREV